METFQVYSKSPTPIVYTTQSGQLWLLSYCRESYTEDLLPLWWMQIELLLQQKKEPFPLVALGKVWPFTHVHLVDVHCIVSTTAFLTPDTVSYPLYMATKIQSPPAWDFLTSFYKDRKKQTVYFFQLAITGFHLTISQKMWN